MACCHFAGEVCAECAPAIIKRVQAERDTLSDALGAAYLHHEKLKAKIEELEAQLAKCPGCGVELQTLSEGKRIVHAQICDWGQDD